ncbi:MAG: helix-turn-helix transcriptional regulator [Rhizobacter sp.]|nr:helix-turn-helix transcriptional regulator [Chlorobiales bacterium]
MTSVYMLRDITQVRAIADPLRMRILEALCHKSMTTKQVALFLDENANKLYHHVELLAAAGLIKLVETKQNRGTLEKYYHAVAEHFTLSPQLFEVRLDGVPANGDAGSSGMGNGEDVTTSAAGGASEVMLSSALQATMMEVKESLARKLITQTDAYGFFTRLQVRASQPEIEKLQSHLQAWINECRAASHDDGETIYGLTLAFYPIEKKSSK